MAHPKTVGVVIGRFQVPVVHNGHRDLINTVLKDNDEACIFVGVADKPSRKNPLTYPAVKAMLAGAFAGSMHKLQIHPLLDRPGSDAVWSKQIDYFLDLLFPTASIRLYAGRDSFKASYSGVHPIVDWLGFDGTVNGTEVRNAIITGDAENSEAFRRGIIYGVGRILS